MPILLDYITGIVRIVLNTALGLFLGVAMTVLLLDIFLLYQTGEYNPILIKDFLERYFFDFLSQYFMVEKHHQEQVDTVSWMIVLCHQPMALVSAFFFSGTVLVSYLLLKVKQFAQSKILTLP